MNHSQNTEPLVAVIGAGPAGIAASIQLKRAGIEPIVFEKGILGGLLNNAFWVENYPGFPNGITGLDLINRFKKHLKAHEIKLIMDRVGSVRRSKGYLELNHGGKACRCRCAIVASGTEPKAWDRLEFGGRVLSHVYPIRNVRNKSIAIVGGGDAAFDYALNLARKNRVTILVRGPRTRALPLLVKRAWATNRITVYSNVRIRSLRQLHNCVIVQVSNRVGGLQTLTFDYLVTAIGREPALSFLAPSLRKTFPAGIPGLLYFAGDVRCGKFRQTSIAVGDGVKAAMQVCLDLSRLDR